MGVVSTTSFTGSIVDPVLQPEIIKITSRQMNMQNLLVVLIDLIC
jgi:hypothetical protein